MKQYFSCWFGKGLPLRHVVLNRGFKRAAFNLFIHPVKRRIARYYLLFLQKFSPIIVIGITGSAGKTTVKEMLKSILEKDGPTVASFENIDPVYNIPTTVLKCGLKTKYLILEMGVEYPGEMDYYLWLAKPDIGVITNIFPTHLEFFKTTDGVLQEKSKLVTRLSKKGIAVLNSEDNLLKDLEKELSCRILWFKKESDSLKTNAQIASTVAKVLKIQKEIIDFGLLTYAKPPHRFETIKLSGGAVVVDDSYNSNPEALRSSLRMFCNLYSTGRKIAVIGDMLELGKNEKRYHQMAGQYVKSLGFDVVIGVGPLSKTLIKEVVSDSKTKTSWVENWESAVSLLKDYLGYGNYIFVKGSRSIGLDRLVLKLI